MPEISKTFIVIPCYNEEKAISGIEYSRFLQNHPEASVCFVNDGSTDNTLLVLQKIQKEHPLQIQLIPLPQNSGKAEAVRQGILFCTQNFRPQHIGYLDADLATTLEEFMAVKNNLDNEIVFCFGSRIRKIGSTINRENSRFLIGRIIATFISNILDLKVYDTQCGCKVFTSEIAQLLFQKEFISKWLFDVELFFRMIKHFGKENALKKMSEIPLKSWIEKGNSKVKPSYFFKLWLDLYFIKKAYKTAKSKTFKPYLVKTTA
ncbi:glycosyl transferase family 2 [Flavobacterium sp. L1I52]|uniref:Glycosyl transferase family 2 n=1 Tax=Flavobacterium pokkalii TaxID=1940408 RepID=A0ABR7URZ1_9FLAO|nr:glycosyltransferase [Flavobacterium pokkalii]MBD0725028.1 glycosyl transferase family 2 [Flavobacterium pokkalii]